MTTTDHREFLAQQADPPWQVRGNLVRLAYDLLEPARSFVGPLHVNSGWRCPGLNAAIGGSKTSAHMDGLAADVFPLQMDLREAYRTLAKTGLPFDQLILEWARWIHIGAPRQDREPRGQLLMIFSPGAYEPYVESDPRVLGVA